MRPFFEQKIILASKSPRRAELLKGLGVDFEIRTKETDESFPEDMPVHQVAGYLSHKKAMDFLPEMGDDEWVLTADTVVISEGKILGKPKDLEDARQMLQQLSGKMHEVVTGITLQSKGQSITVQDTAKVFFKDLSGREIEFYVEHFKPLDKAGSYGIQEWIGYIAVAKIEGSFYTVMGLPVHEVYRLLSEISRS